MSILENILRKEGSFKYNYKPFAVHRLDKDTSGVMMFALTKEMAQIIFKTWHKMVTSRKYIAVAENPQGSIKLLEDSGIINAPLAQNKYHQSYVPVNKFDKQGKKIITEPARTKYKVVSRGKKYTMFELELDTGKKNQIRAHLSYCGYPLAGDENYRAKTDPFNRLALHAKTQRFEHPVLKKELSFEVNEPSNWIKII